MIDRPKSAGLAVSRPKSASVSDQLEPEMLSNGMPPLPADLTFDQIPQPTLHQVPTPPPPPPDPNPCSDFLLLPALLAKFDTSCGAKLEGADPVTSRQ